jgi:hypothetical protein
MRQVFLPPTPHLVKEELISSYSHFALKDSTTLSCHLFETVMDIRIAT